MRTSISFPELNVQRVHCYNFLLGHYKLLLSYSWLSVFCFFLMLLVYPASVETGFGQSVTASRELLYAFRFTRIIPSLILKFPKWSYCTNLHNLWISFSNSAFWDECTLELLMDTVSSCLKRSMWGGTWLGRGGGRPTSPGWCSKYSRPKGTKSCASPHEIMMVASSNSSRFEETCKYIETLYISIHQTQMPLGSY